MSPRRGRNFADVQSAIRKVNQEIATHIENETGFTVTAIEPRIVEVEEVNACFVEVGVQEEERCGPGRNCIDLNDFDHNTTAYRCVDYNNACKDGEIRLGHDTCAVGPLAGVGTAVNDCPSDNFYKENGVCKCVCDNHKCNYGENCEHQFACGVGSQIWRRNDGSFDCYCVPGYESYYGWTKGMDCNTVASAEKVMNGILLIYSIHFVLFL